MPPESQAESSSVQIIDVNVDSVMSIEEQSIGMSGFDNSRQLFVRSNIQLELRRGSFLKPKNTVENNFSRNDCLYP